MKTLNSNTKYSSLSSESIDFNEQQQQPILIRSKMANGSQYHYQQQTNQYHNQSSITTNHHRLKSLSSTPSICLNTSQQQQRPLFHISCNSQASTTTNFNKMFIAATRTKNSSSGPTNITRRMLAILTLSLVMLMAHALPIENKQNNNIVHQSTKATKTYDQSQIIHHERSDHREKRSGIADQRLAELLELARLEVIRKLVRDSNSMVNAHMGGGGNEAIAYGLIDPAIIGRRRRRRRDVSSSLENINNNSKFASDSNESTESSRNMNDNPEKTMDDELDSLVEHLIRYQQMKHRQQKAIKHHKLNRWNHRRHHQLKQKQMTPKTDDKIESSLEMDKAFQEIAMDHSHSSSSNSIPLSFSFLWNSMINQNQLNSQEQKEALDRFIENLFQN